MIFNERKPSKKKRLTWLINENLDFWENSTHNAIFTSNGKRWRSFALSSANYAAGTSYFHYNTESTGSLKTVATIVNGPKTTWVNQAYRTITFDEEPTGDLLTWLEANATPQ